MACVDPRWLRIHLTLLPTPLMARADPGGRGSAPPSSPPSRPLSCPRMRVCPASRDSGLHRRDPVPHPSARFPPVLRRGSPPRCADRRDPLPCRGVLLGLSPVTDLSMAYRGCLSPVIQKLGAISLWIEPTPPEGSTTAAR
jgi:hypothetical protein